MKALIALLLLSATALHAEDWTTTDGKTYIHVTVLKTYPDAVTILDSNGGALIPLASLPPDLQKRFHYDPALAAAAKQARAQSDAENAKALQLEAIQAAKLKAAQDAKQKAADDAVAKRKAAEEAQYHNRMPSEPDVLEVQKKENNDAIAKPK